MHPRTGTPIFGPRNPYGPQSMHDDMRRRAQRRWQSTQAMERRMRISMAVLLAVTLATCGLCIVSVAWESGALPRPDVNAAIAGMFGRGQ